MSTATRLMTADELLAMGDIGRCELIYGELVMMSPAGAEHGVIAGRIYRAIADFVEAANLGQTFAAETGFKLATDPDLVRAPDVAFVRKGRLPGKLPKGFFEGVPDLVVEVISPEDRKREVAEKVNTWLAHGATSCWVVDPATKSIEVRRSGQKPVRYPLDEELRDDTALPEFRLSVQRIFDKL